jgi:hypothetical protein
MTFGDSILPGSIPPDTKSSLPWTTPEPGAGFVDPMFNSNATGATQTNDFG